MERTMSAWDDINRDLMKVDRDALEETALTIAEQRGDHYVVGGPRAWSKDELISYIVGPKPAWQQRTEATR
jgi:hypothetical protein